MRAETKELPSLEYLKECFDLDPTCPSGLRWKKRPRNHFDSDLPFLAINGKFAGKAAGHLWTSKDKIPRHYWLVRIARLSYKVHRVVYAMYSEEYLPTDVEIDHRNGDGLDNSPDNLRKSDRETNSYNNRIRSNNTSGHKGIYWSKSQKGWVGRVQFKGTRYKTGVCPTLEIAIKLTQELRESLHKEFANNG